MVEENIRVSEWNSAMYKMQRIHEITDKINKLFQCPLGMDEITGEFNYKLIAYALDSLYKEVRASLTEDEKNKADTFREKLREVIKESPVRNNNNKLNLENWEQIEKGLWIYENLVRDYVLKTGMDTPEQQDFSGWD